MCVAAAAGVLSLCGRFMEALLRAGWTTFSGEEKKRTGERGRCAGEKRETEGDGEKFYGLHVQDRLTDLIVFTTSQKSSKLEPADRRHESGV